jgi:hypothetical protein
MLRPNDFQAIDLAKFIGARRTFETHGVGGLFIVTTFPQDMSFLFSARARLRFSCA